MPITDIVDLTITTAAAGPSQKGFGKPLILGYSQRFPERLRSYRSTVEMAADGFLTTDPEYLAASKLEAQNPRVEQWSVGRGNNRPTQSVRITVSQVLANTKYAVKVDGVEVSYTSDAAPTTDEIRAGLAAAIDAAASPIASQPLAVGVAYFDLLNAIGVWTSIEVLDPSLLAAHQTHGDPGVAADLDAVKLYDDSWYALILAGATSDLLVLAAAAWVETAKKLMVVASSDTVLITQAAGNGDLADTVKTTNYARTAVIYHPSPRDFADAAWLGNRLPYTPGAETWKFARLSGVATTKLTATHQNNLNAKRANYFYEVAGISFTAEGKVGANEFIDVVRGRDWQEARISEGVFGALATAGTKIPFTDKGAQVVAGAISQALRAGVLSGLLAEDPAPAVNVPKVSTVSSTDKGNRLLPGITFSATLAGAIHKVKISGQLAI